MIKQIQNPEPKTQTWKLGFLFLAVGCWLLIVSSVQAWTISKELQTEVQEKKAAVVKTPNDAFARFDLAVTYSYTNHILESWEEIKKIPDLDPSFKKKGLIFYIEKVTENPQDWKLRFRLAFALYFNGRKAEAIEQFKNVLIIDPYNVWAYGYISLAYGEMDKIDEAILWAKKGIKVDRFVAALHLLLSQGYYRKGDNWSGFAEAAETLRLKALGY